MFKNSMQTIVVEFVQDFTSMMKQILNFLIFKDSLIHVMRSNQLLMLIPSC